MRCSWSPPGASGSRPPRRPGWPWPQWRRARPLLAGGKPSADTSSVGVLGSVRLIVFLGLLVVSQRGVSVGMAITPGHAQHVGDTTSFGCWCFVSQSTVGSQDNMCIFWRPNIKKKNHRPAVFRLICRVFISCISALISSSLAALMCDTNHLFFLPVPGDNDDPDKRFKPDDCSTHVCLSLPVPKVACHTPTSYSLLYWHSWFVRPHGFA